MDLHLATSKHLAVIDKVRAAYRTMWSSFSPPYACDFTGTRTDIDALDFIQYETGTHPRGLFGAALVWGGVIAKTGLLGWLVSQSGDYMLGSTEYPRFLIWPLARTQEIENTGIPQFGKYNWLLEEAVARCISQGGFADAEEKRLVSLLDIEPGEGYLWSTSRAIARIRSSVRHAST